MATTKLRLLAIVLFIAAAFFPQYGKAQIFDNKAHVDTLKFGERISLRTNVVDWTLLTPNIGVEFDVRSTNWNRWAVGLTLKSKWKTNSTFKQEIFYSITEARVDFRNYWRTRQIDGEGVKAHTGFLDRLFSCRRRVVKHPKTTYYRGVYASVSDFSVKLGARGRQGKAVSAGITYGIIKPLYVFKTGNSLDLDLGFDAGFIATNAEKFKLDRAEDCYVRTEAGKWKFVPFPMPTSARVGFVYRFGKYPVTKKYRWRYDADADYKYRMDTIASNAAARAYNKQIRDSIQSRIFSEFWHAYDSTAVVNAKSAAARKVELEKQRIEAEKQRAIAEQQAKERQRAEKAAEKEAEKAKKQDTPADSTTTEQPVATEIPTDSIATEPSVEQSTDSVATEPSAAAESTEQPSATESSEPSAAKESTEPSAATEESKNSDEGGAASTDNNETTINNSENETEATEGKEGTDEQ